MKSKLDTINRKYIPTVLNQPMISPYYITQGNAFGIESLIE